ncbi:nuclear transport factor 2 family protein [Aspergillus lucknowensis]|uniref:SnoaL-like domain-containing protein n=1 Tax=Aspergillus lucknowensis TaxID=176173 RepID=A0ABR4M4X5_9EURO
MASLPSLPAVLSPALSDREAITDAIHRFPASPDTNDRALFESAFTRTATFEINGAVSEGLPALLTNCYSPLSRLDTTHFLTNVRVNIAGDNTTAAATAAALSQHYKGGKGMEAGQPALLVGSLYYVEFVKEEDELWRMERFRMKTTWSDGDWGIINGPE